MKCAIVTFVIGEKYQQMYDQFFRPSVESYCKKFDIELKLITEPLGEFTEKQSLCCQKLLLCSQEWAKEYDAICWMESDILISPNALNIFDEVTDNKILFAEDENNFEYWSYLKRNNRCDTDFNMYKSTENMRNIIKSSKAHDDSIDFTDEDDMSNVKHINEGICVFQPKYHAEYLKKLYDCHTFGTVNQRGKDDTFLAIGETWWWYKVMKDGMHRYISDKFNRTWPYYRRTKLEPFDDPQTLIIPIKNYIETSYFCHIGDREHIDLIHFVDKMYFRKPDTTLVVKCGPVDCLGWLFISYIRAKKFKNVYIVCKDESAKQFIFNNFPRIQNAWYLPENLYTFVHEVPRVHGRVIECDSDWIKYKDIQSMIDLFYEDKNDNDLIRVRILHE